MVVPDERLPGHPDRGLDTNQLWSRREAENDELRELARASLLSRPARANPAGVGAKAAGYWIGDVGVESHVERMIGREALYERLEMPSEQRS